MSINIAWILFLFGAIFAALFPVSGERTRQRPRRRNDAIAFEARADAADSGVTGHEVRG